MVDVGALERVRQFASREKAKREEKQQATRRVFLAEMRRRDESAQASVMRECLTGNKTSCVGDCRRA